ncbi:MAG: tRNA (adenosine(37)-N6)-threonylcarbamoyltransferase complex dimerization subunit type 1 TsaB [Candidatus Nanopelagicales bacterium]|jgi:tRNA threonylcarbamoyladenosine biosynthesis protein TsaB|nr:tRNA (adenosine(37)-N6)-threonylcarbamoyltransferase complex dimerization subunit type 1 TsaB [Actinomycetota bacterium]MDA3026059.1 tRNA (adenosine(37)-N6)-threonylcarbamoyltransferase complex dimerization subunit type 1 TsaB [Actinomycetota bacterium]MDP4668700.1 tRNA (adenosine(37)-N6)-threonylcarbamoyltransferase complex dimerization subunit type 1 TsaB [Candidatus Nanopelagicales bacterium]MDP4746418.1 tRNA (adenosine(37)-N6)-threonylcarbamoyltransferase complex dimerization subunit type
MKGPTNLLAIDTSTNRIAVALLQFGKQPVVAIKDDGLRHAEYAAELIKKVVSDAGLMMQELGGIVCGIGPGPFTGLRVGIVSAQSIGFVLSIPVFGVCSHDAIAFEYAQQNPNKDSIVITDARRKEVYWTKYQGIKRTSSPKVSKLEEVPTSGVHLLHKPLDPISLAQVAIEAMNRTEKGIEIKSFATDLATGDGSIVALPNQVLLPPIPLYLRKPDALTLAERS